MQKSRAEGELLLYAQLIQGILWCLTGVIVIIKSILNFVGYSNPSVGVEVFMLRLISILYILVTCFNFSTLATPAEGDQYRRHYAFITFMKYLRRFLIIWFYMSFQSESMYVKGFVILCAVQFVISTLLVLQNKKDIIFFGLSLVVIISVIIETYLCCSII